LGHPGTPPAAGDHPRDPGERPFNRMSFTFNVAFPSYRFEFVDNLIGDGSGKPIPLKGIGVLRVVFNGAQAHTRRRHPLDDRHPALPQPRDGPDGGLRPGR